MNYQEDYFIHIDNKTKDIINSINYVDLGLSVLWATTNVGAKDEKEFGDYVHLYLDRYTPIFKHIPTVEQWKELINKCAWVKETKDGIAGYRIYSNITRNKIFLPAAGIDMALEKTLVNNTGLYWSSSLVKGKFDQIYNLAFDGWFINPEKVYYDGFGRSLRLIKQK